MNKEAGRGGLLFITIRLDGGEELPFLLDTGASGTVLDKSLEPKLGKRLGTEPANGWSTKGKANTFAAPKLYLGNTPLITGGKVWTGDLDRPSGILGMDCLKHYCLQLDFEAEKIRFLNSDGLDTAQLGKAYPLFFKGNLPFIHHTGLLGGLNTNLLIDMGCRVDGLAGIEETKGIARFLTDCVWDGTSYTNLAVAAVANANVAGIGFFARHLVTLDFPKRTMYLKQTSVGPLAGDNSAEVNYDESEAPVKFLESLKENDKLPGVSKIDGVEICLEAYSNFDFQPEAEQSVAYVRAYFNSSHKSVTFSLRKKGDTTVCHYVISRASKEMSWRLERAWRTGKGGKKIQDLQVP